MSSKRDPLSGRVGHLSDHQQEALTQFRTELKNEGYLVPLRHDDACLLRFLRARKFDIPKAKAMITSQERWRKDFGVDELHKGFDFPEKAEVDKYYPQFYHKTDKDGRPVYIERLGKIDVKALYTITTQERLLKRLVYEYERCLNDRFPACTIHSKSEIPIETSCTILDLHNVGISAFVQVKDYVFKASAIGQDHYPESMGKFFIINSPWGFSTIWKFIKPWLDEVTVAKINILGSSYQKELLAQIPPENLPVDLGGTCACEGGCSLSDDGPWNDPEIIKKVEEWKEERRKRVDAEEKDPATSIVALAPEPSAPAHGISADLPQEGDTITPVVS
ncbi:CRAL-TRIO domain-containing protein [Cantharellus anzutake]|uniref:CRAL-TRIO domain-containing protein n=1 Tax=Cantharellus anzutake TaxID=1750568 RepID=UPI0019090445|nr:CRAL-TRIO domain-containing protein [Cantharellus anzutake]KAF8336457.1 CRAL-TRIO domain-containing protein [Cantharellus anzutake]